jgi:hypothetical protein
VGREVFEDLVNRSFDRVDPACNRHRG